MHSSSQDKNRTNSQSFKNLEENVAIVSPSVAIAALVWIYRFYFGYITLSVAISAIVNLHKQQYIVPNLV